jgi:hypothetical protein
MAGVVIGGVKATKEDGAYDPATPTERKVVLHETLLLLVARLE